MRRIQFVFYTFLLSGGIESGGYLKDLARIIIIFMILLF